MKATSIEIIMEITRSESNVNDPIAVAAKNFLLIKSIDMDDPRDAKSSIKSRKSKIGSFKEKWQAPMYSLKCLNTNQGQDRFAILHWLMISLRWKKSSKPKLPNCRRIKASANPSAYIRLSSI